LESGKYLIRSRLRDTFVGRSLREDRSLRPKAIVSVDGPDNQTWSVESLGGDRYILSIRGGRTAIVQGRVFAVLLPDPQPEVWTIRRQASGYYTIENSDRRGGWILPDEEVLSRPLIIGPSNPPFFPPNELWEFI
ncbi:hypothetical protein BD779DRAFT_1410757, partial [Infundibulicybe gibba]